MKLGTRIIKLLRLFRRLLLASFLGFQESFFIDNTEELLNK